jgi:hypothetical protein
VLVGFEYGNSDQKWLIICCRLPSMANYSKPDVITQVEKIRSEIRQFGESRVGCEELSLLCSDVSAMDEKIGIEQIAEYEGWSFQYLPNGHVRFAPTALRTRPQP